MTETLQKTEKQQKFDQWLEALRSGDYIQATNALHIQDADVEAYCCVGILDEVVYGTQWYKPADADAGYFEYVDDEGESTMTSPDRVVDLDLHRNLNATERRYFEDFGIDVEGHVSRLTALAMMNDFGQTFDTIAGVVEELGWNS